MLVGRGVSSRSGGVGRGLEQRWQSIASVSAAVACDSADPFDTRALVGASSSLDGMLHAAGVDDKKLMAELQWLLAQALLPALEGSAEERAAAEELLDRRARHEASQFWLYGRIQPVLEEFRLKQAELG